MPPDTNIRSGDLDRRESQLTLFACVSIGLLAVGTALLMYPVVFARSSSQDKTLPIAFCGFCILSVLLAGYLWDRQRTIQRLRRQVADERVYVLESQRQASVELLKTMPNFSSFQDRLPMEYRRTIATSEKLSILVITVTLQKNVSPAGSEMFMLGDAAKVVARRLREQDSIYILAPTSFGAVLPGADLEFAQAIRGRIAEGLADAAGASNRFTYRVEIVNYPTDATSAHELERAVSALLPSENLMHKMAHATS